MKIFAGLLLLLACIAPGSAAATSEQLPDAISRDPRSDGTPPASGEAVRIASHDQRMNAMVYLPAGKEPHPVAIVLHGFPGNEQNLDLAQAMRRAGWAVVTFHYRGSWGSEGRFTFDGAVEDGEAVFAWVHDPANVRRLRLDAQRIVVVGHSMGGYVAAALCAAHTQVRGCVLLAPWDLSFDTHLVANLSDAERDRTARDEFADVDGRVAGMSARDVVDILAAQGQRWQLAKFAHGIATHPTLIVLATRDADDDKALDLLPALKAEHPASLRVETIDSDHSFNDRRIALQSAVLKWLAKLPGAPAR
jgi:pimeloyl-ACP methyl ester carboxylesterase